MEKYHRISKGSGVMAIIKNKTKHTIRFVAYRADGSEMHQKATKIQPDKSRYVSSSYTGGIDWFIITAFLPESSIQDHVDVDILPAIRNGDDALAFAKVGIEEKFVFVEDPDKKEFGRARRRDSRLVS
ncbi:hypothetical protein MmTuc01_0263 [Methanosarcina mazei Tuc01]|uniref:Uncharacterized protein n=1 Tax=Methanosarcina mazei Tuc01 TaxID=1236903 RepID=M1P5P5_METMZ|nr:hypothetical protein MmTuc01_0263 [Methanosarcina mazei Tuc01]